VLPAGSRLRRRVDFAATIRGGQRAGRGRLVVHLTTTMKGSSTVPARTEEETLPVRAGFVVPKAVGGAVLRNRVRRRLRHLMRDRLTALPAGSRVVVRALAGAADREYSELARDLDGALAAALHRRGRPRRGPRP